MPQEMDTAALAVLALCILGWGVWAGSLERWNVTAPIAFVLAGLLVANEPLALIDVQPHSATVRTIAELTLALVLFNDAARVNVRVLRADAAIPARLLLVGLPLTIAAGTAAAAVCIGGIDLWVAAVLGAAVAPTDAALGAPIMEDTRIPGRVRRVLNVESGLNDGIATPFVWCFLAGATGAAVAGGPLGALLELGLGVAVGGVIGAGGGWLLLQAVRRGWTTPSARPLTGVALALLAYAAAIELGGNGFVGAFVGGMAFGTLHGDGAREDLELSADAGEVLSVFVWFVFGAVMLDALDATTWSTWVFAVLALTVVRMVPVGLALLGAGLDRSTVMVIGWFGPRGLASVVFALLAFDALPGAEGERALATIAAVVLLSVILHGVSAAPIARRYASGLTRLATDRPEHVATTPLPTRPFVRARAASRRSPGEGDAGGSGAP